MQSGGTFFVVMTYGLLAMFGGPPTMPDAQLRTKLMLLHKTDNVPMDIVESLIATRVSPKRLADLNAKAKAADRTFHSVLYDEGVRIDWTAARRLQRVTLGITERVAEIADDPVYADLSDSAQWYLALLDYTPKRLDMIPYRVSTEDELIEVLAKHDVRLTRRDTALLMRHSYERIH